jgi:UDP-N-acetylmuramate dehydrogenase
VSERDDVPASKGSSASTSSSGSVRHDVPLAPLTTLGLGGRAKRFARATSIDELRDALRSATRVLHDAFAPTFEPVLILGGGSNLVVRDSGFDGLVIQIAIPGVRIEHHGDHADVVAFAGVPWDELVAEMIAADLAGLECMSGIPGLVGATPMQNVGAYGQEVSDTITLVRVMDRETGEMESFEPAACKFAYRSSVFRGSERWVVVEVHFRLPVSTDSRPIRYAELAKALAIPDGGTAPLQTVRDTVIALRRGKGMVVDPSDPESRSAGSFFTNPIVSAQTLVDVHARAAARVPGATMPTFAAAEGKTKLSAGWLIEHAGFVKGTARGNVGISTKHALALVNRGGTTAELLGLAAEIQAAVRDVFGVELLPEPIIVGD